MPVVPQGRWAVAKRFGKADNRNRGVIVPYCRFGNCFFEGSEGGLRRCPEQVVLVESTACGTAGGGLRLSKLPRFVAAALSRSFLLPEEPVACVDVWPGFLLPRCEGFRRAEKESVPAAAPAAPVRSDGGRERQTCGEGWSLPRQGAGTISEKPAYLCCRYGNMRQDGIHGPVQGDCLCTSLVIYIRLCAVFHPHADRRRWRSAVSDFSPVRISASGCATRGRSVCWESRGR